MTRFRPLTFSHRAYFTLEDIQEAVSSRSLKMSSFGKHYFTYKWGLIYNQTALGTALNSATPQWIRHSVVTGEQQLIGPNFPALRHNWFSRLHFRFSCLSTTELPEISRCAHSNLNSLTLTFQTLNNFLWSVLYPYPKFHENLITIFWVILQRDRRPWQQYTPKSGGGNDLKFIVSPLSQYERLSRKKTTH